MTCVLNVNMCVFLSSAGTPEDKMRLFLIFYITAQQAPSEVGDLTQLFVFESHGPYREHSGLLRFLNAVRFHVVNFKPLNTLDLLH